MPSRFLINAERERLESFPKEIGDIDKTAFFTLTEGDLEIIKRRTGEENRFGFAILLCCLRFLGFIPIDLSTIPNEVFEYLAGQIELEETKLPIYERSRTKQTQIKEIFAYTGFRRIRKKDLEILESWLVRRAADGDSRRTFMGERFLSFCQPRNISDPE